MANERNIIIATAQNRFSTSWRNETLRWSSLCELLSTPIGGAETLVEYKAMPTSIQDSLKDVGGFTGELKGKRRNAQAVVGRDLVTLDLDNIPEDGTQAVLDKIDSQGCTYCVYSTRKHSPERPRLRLVVPLNRTVTPDEYEPIARKLAEYVGIEMCDPSTFQASRMMYFPSVCRDAEFIFKKSDVKRPWVDADGLLAQYSDWKDARLWPVVPGEEARVQRMKRTVGDPLEKEGAIGAFCRVYDIHHAIAEFLQGVYVSCGSDRYTYAAGSTSGGAVVYEGKFLYSNHATDPASGQLCNAFDLVRIHMFGHLDAEVAPYSKPSDYPSLTHMMRFASSRPEVFNLMLEDRQKLLVQDFGDAPVSYETEAENDKEADTQAVRPTDDRWKEKLERTKNGGIAKTRNNILCILMNDAALCGRIAYDSFTERLTVFGSMPWAEQDENETRVWTDADDAGLRWYIEQCYQITSRESIEDALALAAQKNKRDSLADYLNGLKWDGRDRLDRMFVDYLGAPDTQYVREATRKQMCAAVCRGLKPGTKHDVMLVLTGPQGIGKSTMLALLGGTWFNDSISDFEGRDAYESLLGYWIVEVPELASMNKSEVNTVKTFLSKQEDTYRSAYGRRTTTHPRRCVFFGTTNDHEYLRDVTGSRRFWPIEVGIQAPKKNVFTDLKKEREQLWAEAVTRLKAGESLLLSEEGRLGAVNAQEEHREHSVKEGMVAEFIKKPIPADWDKWELAKRRLWWTDSCDKNGVETVERTSVCAAELWAELFGSDINRMKRADSIELNNIITSVGGWKRADSAFRAGPYGQQRGFVKNDYKVRL